MKKKLPSLLVATIFIFYSTGNAGSVNLKKGKRVFNKCKACHTLVTGKNRVGPSLKGVFGRQAGTVAKYRYSKAMKKAGRIYGRIAAQLERKVKESLFFKEEEVRWSTELAEQADIQGI